jgi:HlyD family secretion protein
MQIEAQRRDVVWKLSRTEVRAPVAGIISRRSARLGAVASGSAVAQPMFHMIANGSIELEADVPEVDLVRLKPGMTSTVAVMGSLELAGAIRLVSPEVDKASRLGRVRISLPEDSALKIGSFGRGNILVRSGEAITLPSSALLFGTSGTYVQIVEANRVVSRKVTIGMQSGGMQSGDAVEIASGVIEGEIVVARSGTFLRTGDLVTPVESRN